MPPPTDGLVGRRRELRAARDAVDAALSGAGGLLLITGEAGIGKTRPTETLARRITARTTGPAQQLRLRLFDSVAAYLTEVSRRAPLMILIEATPPPRTSPSR